MNFMKWIYRLAEYLFFKFQHDWSVPYPAFYPVNESYPVSKCLKCGEIDEIAEFGYCNKWYKESEQDINNLPF